MHQTVIGQEALAQFELAGEHPDVVIGCAGGGSSFGGFVLPMLPGKVSGERDMGCATTVWPPSSPISTSCV